MSTTLIISLLLLLVAIDAIGDSFRFLNRQFLHHAMESIQIAGWFCFAVLFAFICMNSVQANQSVWMVILSHWHYALIYVLGRIWLFDILWNILTGHDPLYMGKNDLFGRSVRLFSAWVMQDYKHFSFMLKFLALIAWIGLILKANGISI